jgi:hypothetical protein
MQPVRVKASSREGKICGYTNISVLDGEARDAQGAQERSQLIEACRVDRRLRGADAKMKALLTQQLDAFDRRRPILGQSI